MGLLERVGLREVDSRVPELRSENQALGRSLVDLTERLAELELALEDQNWVRLSFETGQEFSRTGLQRIMDLSRLFFLKNPLINRAVTLQAMYVWGQDVSIQATQPQVDTVVQLFKDDKQNQAELMCHQAQTMKEQDLQIDGNLFFVLFANMLTGRVRVSSIPPDEILEIHTSPDNRKEPWYYKRVWSGKGFSTSSGLSTVDPGNIAYYPDWRYSPDNRPESIAGHSVMWESPIYHVKVGGTSNMLFGVPETYSGLDWARAYKEFLEDWATIVRAYSKFAFQMTTKGGKKGIAAAKSRLGTTIGSADYAESNPPPGAGSLFVATEGTNLQPVRTAGATTSADDGRRMLLMVAAATGLPESFFGDVSVGTLATAKSLDRPTELKFLDRQKLWADILDGILQYTVAKRATAFKYPDLRGVLVWNEEGDDRYVVLETDAATGEPIDCHIDIDFPSILEHDKDADVKAIVSAATLDGKPPAGTMTMPQISRLLLSALGQDDIDDLLAEIFPEGDDQAEQKFVAVVAEVREALRELVKASDPVSD